MTVPTGWLTDPLGAGSPNVQALLPVPADGTYTEPADATPVFTALPFSTASVGLVNGGGSVASRTDAIRASQARLRRTTVFGVVLLDAVTMPGLGAPIPDVRPPVTPTVPGVRPVTPPPSACAVRPLPTTIAACGARPAPTVVVPEGRP